MPLALSGGSPRLGLNRTARITIKDNDDPQGVLSFRTTLVKVPENATSGKSRKVELEVQRTKGTFGDVSVLVRTVGGGERWSPTLQSLKNAIAGKKGEKNATIGTDYVELSTRVTFPVRLFCSFCFLVGVLRKFRTFSLSFSASFSVFLCYLMASCITCPLSVLSSPVLICFM